MPSNVAAPVDQQTLVKTAAAGILAALVIAALYFGRPVLVPFALAVLLAFALSPAAEFLRRIGLPRALAVILTVTTAVFLIGGFGTFVGTQIGLLAADLPHYQVNLTHKIESVRGAAAGNSIVSNASALFANLDKAIVDRPRNTAQPATPVLRQNGPRAIPVEVRQPDLAPFQVIESIVDPLLEPLATLSLAIIFVVFILLPERRSAKPVHLAGGIARPAADHLADRRRRQQAQPLPSAADRRQRRRRIVHRHRPVAVRCSQSRFVGLDRGPVPLRPLYRHARGGGASRGARSGRRSGLDDGLLHRPPVLFFIDGGGTSARRSSRGSMAAT